MTEQSAATKLRWARGQRFKLTAPGVTALQGYQDGVKINQQAGKAAFDAFVNQWSQAQKVDFEDGFLLGELSAPRKLEELVESVADTGASREGVKKALERLHGAGLIEAVTSSP